MKLVENSQNLEKSGDTEKVAKAIARSIPLGDCSRWAHGHGENFPREYSEAEKRLIRGIARSAIEAMRS